MNIGEAAAASGVSAKMIRHYETLGLITPMPRTNNYRSYTDQNVAVLRFIRHARDLAFPLSEVKRLLALWRNDGRESSDVREIALSHVDALEEKARSLKAVADSLRHLAQSCQGSVRPECPNLDQLGARVDAHH